MSVSIEIKEERLRDVAIAANVILVAGGIACLLALLYFLHFYGWTGQRQFAGWAGALVHCVFPAAVGLMLFASLRLRASHRINLAILFSSAILSIWGAEAYLTFLRPKSTMGMLENIPENRWEINELASAEGINFDFRSPMQVVLDFRKRGVNAVPMPSILLENREDAQGLVKSRIHINGQEVVPLGGISNRKTVFCNETGEYAVYDSDEHGFHNPPGIWGLQKVDVIALGDSFTQGGCVPSERNFVALLRRLYPATLNLGIAGAGPLSMLGALREALTVTQPKIVLWFYYEESDLRDLVLEQKNQVLSSYLDDNFSQGILSRQKEIDQALSEFFQEYVDTAQVKTSKSVARLTSVAKLSVLRTRLGLIREDREPNAEETATSETSGLQSLLGRILSKARDLVSRSGGQLHFVYLPDLNRYADYPNARTDREAVLSVVESLKIPVIDIHPVFNSHIDPLSLFPFRRFPHYSERGHGAVAKAVLKYLSSNSHKYHAGQ